MAAQTNASAMPVLPLVASTIVVRPGSIRPSASAASIIATPMRSLTLPPGLKASSLANSCTPFSAAGALEQRGQLDQRRLAHEFGNVDRDCAHYERDDSAGRVPPGGAQCFFLASERVTLVVEAFSAVGLLLPISSFAFRCP